MYGTNSCGHFILSGHSSWPHRFLEFFCFLCVCNHCLQQQPRVFKTFVDLFPLLYVGSLIRRVCVCVSREWERKREKYMGGFPCSI